MDKTIEPPGFFMPKTISHPARDLSRQAGDAERRALIARVSSLLQDLEAGRLDLTYSEIASLIVDWSCGATSADSARFWEEAYGDLWKLKIGFEKQHNR